MYLVREECLGPISLSEIEPGLFLGGLAAARDIPTLKTHGITHILTIDTCPLPAHLPARMNLTTKFIRLSDQPKEDLLSHFDDAYEFISGVRQLGGVVLVHCYYGVSRSAAIVLAYVMKHKQLKLSEAIDLVRSKRPVVSPNVGFIDQLELYEAMGCNINRNNQLFKAFRLTLAADRVKRFRVLPNDFYDLIKDDPGLPQIQPEPNVYKCKMCRRVLATESNLLEHKDKATDKKCQRTFFFEPLTWMATTKDVNGKLHCPKCKSKLGSFSWNMGCRCPCGRLMAPAFYLVSSKVDFSNVVQNVEATL